jgi:hypothetical protein
MTPEHSVEQKILPVKTREDQPNPHADDQEVFVRRGSGEVVKMRLADQTQLDEKQRRIGYMVEADEEDGSEYIFAHKPLGETTLSPQHQSQLAEEFAANQQMADDFEQVAAERARQFVGLDGEGEKSAVEAPLSEAQEEIADVAIEVATGIEDPSEVDESMHKYSLAELRAMREARRTAENEASTNPYDALLDPNTPNVEAEKPADVYTYLKEALPPVTRGDTEASRKYYDKFVTDENRQTSLDFLGEAIKADARIAAIIHEAGLKPTDMATVDAIRENPDVRYEIAKRLTQKLDVLVDQDPEGFGYRIADNSPNNLKVDPQTGKRMRSRMYAVDMALKMLGGEFSERNEAKDFARDKNDRVATAQHRHAATATIMSRYA